MIHSQFAGFIKLLHWIIYFDRQDQYLNETHFI